MKQLNRRMITIAFAFAPLACLSAAPVVAPHALAIDDVLGLEHLDHVTISPDGEWVAVDVQRPAKAGEVYGRTAYEIDPSRNDVWLISRRTHERRNLTQGESLAAGFWCASWSPDGHRLAMLSTRPEAAEPHGGDNVRVYVWDRDTNQLNRLGNVAVMTQTRYGGAIHRLDLRGGADQSTVTHSCGAENSPFLWLDDHRLLAATLPDGQVSGLIDEASRPFRIEARDAQRLSDGTVATGEAIGSGAERVPAGDDAKAIIRTIDVTRGTWHVVASVSAYPFRGDLSLSVSPDGKRLAVLAPVAAFPPVAGRRFPHADAEDWTIEKRLGVVDLHDDASMRWISLPANALHPLELLAWSQDSRHFALRSRRDAFDDKPLLLVADASTGRARTIGTGTMDQVAAGTIYPHEQQLIWLDPHHLLARLHGPNGDRLDWWRLALDGTAVNLTAMWKAPPSTFRHLTDGRLAAVAGRTVVSLNSSNGRSTIIADIGADGGSFVWPIDPALPATNILVETTSSGNDQIVHIIDASGPHRPPITLPAAASLLVSQGRLLWQLGDQSGLFLNESDPATGRTEILLPLDTSLASIAWGRTTFFDYHTTDGKLVKGAAILPPDYRPDHRYPTLLWVYEGHSIDEHGEYFLDPQMPGIYNLQLYAAEGYVVLLPSMPLPADAERKDVYAAVTNGVMPAIDKLVDLGIADPDRLGVFGQSYGGYSVYALLTQTDRFKAGVAMAGITDLEGLYEQSDPLARGYSGIAHEKSTNWFIADQFGLHAPPTEDHHAYWQNSPLAHVDHVHTPLLILHGSHDIRGSITQAEQFFYSLYSQGKTARLVRYDGESHSLAQSPANVRDIFRETIDWFDRYVKDAR